MTKMLKDVLRLVCHQGLSDAGMCNYCRCLFNASLKNESTSTICEEFSRVASLDLVMNVFRDGQWGSFRHLPIQSGEI